MLIIKLDAIDSTNLYLKQLSVEKNLNDFTVVTTKKQTKGRGQMGTIWNSQEAKSLMISVYKDISYIKLEQQFYISMVTSLTMIKTLKELTLPKLTIKWPNDILSDDKKICGILIENAIKQDRLMASIIGVGLNVNQTEFDNLPRASSLKLIKGNTFNMEEILNALLQNLKFYFTKLKNKDFDNIKNEYESYLFRKNKPSTFKNIEGDLFSGFIKGVTNSGKLSILLEDNIIKEFNLKEITLLY
jgi:BirA family biotin operon repressor/biotin-[acetyl-CoA-carboxylase] ligase